MKTYFHVDMDAFFVSVEELFDPSLKGKPVVVGGQADQRGVVSAASYAARKFGVHSAMPLRTAARLCPHAIFVSGHPTRYREYSRKVYNVLKTFSPQVEMASVDEAYMDLTGTERLHGPPLSARNLLSRDQKGAVALDRYRHYPRPRWLPTRDRSTSRAMSEDLQSFRVIPFSDDQFARADRAGPPLFTWREFYTFRILSVLRPFGTVGPSWEIPILEDWEASKAAWHGGTKNPDFFVVDDMYNEYDRWNRVETSLAFVTAQLLRNLVAMVQRWPGWCVYLALGPGGLIVLGDRILREGKLFR